MDQVIICTTINNPTEAIEKYDSMSNWTLIVVGDKKTPTNYKLNNGIYLSPEDQVKIDLELSELIGWNCIQRRNFGFLFALNSNAKVLCSVDDDNIPLDNWGKELFVNQTVTVKEFKTDLDVFDPIGATNHKELWHRGYPLELIHKRDYSKFNLESIKPEIQADFWNGDPDIDAFCRLEHRPNCSFLDSAFPFSSNKISPFNSQNTFLSRKVALDYFLYPHIGRMDDIWAAYYVQALGHKVIYNKSTVYQDRNEHNLIEDLKKEYLGYERNLDLVKQLRLNVENITKFLPERSLLAWNRYKELIN
jgi:hypothetical protein